MKKFATKSFLLLSLFTIFSTIPITSSTPPSLSYSDHCSSTAPESNQTIPDYTIYPHLQSPFSYFHGGDGLLTTTTTTTTTSTTNFSQFSFSHHKYISFEPTKHIFKTNTNGVYKIEAYLHLQSTNDYYYSSHGRYFNDSRSSVKFLLNGFLSEKSGKICMVGSAKNLNFHAVLKLNYVMNPTIVDSLISGSLVSLSSSTDSNYFEPVWILGFSETHNYKYSGESGNGCDSGIDFPVDQSLSLPPRKFCSSQRRIDAVLTYKNECNSSTKKKNCTVLDDGIDYLPRVMSMDSIQCSEEERKVRFLIQFGNGSYMGYDQPFEPNSTLVAEALWDAEKSQLCIVACRVLKDDHVGDCSIRMSLRYPALWSIKNREAIVGQIWTNKTVNEAGYFNKILFGSYENNMVGVSGLRYNYTQMERVSKSCPMNNNNPVKRKGERYPEANSYDMRLHNMRIKDSKAKNAHGYAYPVFVGDESYEDNSMVVFSSVRNESEMEAKTSYTGPLNISYVISIYGISSLTNFASNPLSNPFNVLQISAEGVYDEETGNLCMVGCTKLSKDDQRSKTESMDCEVVVKFQYQPMNSKNGGQIKGTIKSTRKETDPLYFEQLEVSASTYYTEDARNSIWRMDLEIAMVLISNTLACVFVVLQIFYVRKNPGLLPLASLVMLVILVFGHMIPLVLNFETLFLEKLDRRRQLLRSGGWFEVNEVMVRIVTMAAFLLQFRLLQLTWSARLGGEKNQKASWVAEKKALFVSIPLYIVGFLVALFLNLRNNKSDNSMYSSYDVAATTVVHQQNSLWGDLKSYGGLVLDGFLFPQILLNMFRISGEKPLSRSFYIGTTFVRLLPHAYDLYRAHNYAREQFEESYIYANPSADYYSTAWDVGISCGGVAFAIIIYLQQRFGGRFFLPRRFREAEAVYEKVPVVSSE
ncbi:hypothetical protein CsSME_00018569 [Camellia sinensis var. sinensis]